MSKNRKRLTYLQVQIRWAIVALFGIPIVGIAASVIAQAVFSVVNQGS